MAFAIQSRMVTIHQKTKGHAANPGRFSWCSLPELLSTGRIAN